MKLNKMKKILIVTALVAVTAFSQGCGNNDYDDEETSEIEEYEEDEGELEEAGEEAEEEEEEVVEEVEEEAEEAEEGVTIDEVVRVGSSDNGYVTVPDDWKDLTIDNGDVLVNQYTSADGSASITLFANREPVGSAAETATITQENIEAQGHEIIGTTVSEIDGYESYEIMAESPEGIKSFMWFFEAEEGCVHSLIAEGSGELFDVTMGLVGTSYAVNE